MVEPYIHPRTYVALYGSTSGQELIRRYEAGERDFRGFDLLGAKLSGADLRGCDLSGAYLSLADLSEANLTGANLQRAHLNQTNLDRANLRGTNLASTDLDNASLVGANLYEANLRGAELNYTHIARANFDKANIVESEFKSVSVDHVDLRGVCLCMASLPNDDHLSSRQLLHAMELGKFYAPSTASSGGLNLRARILTLVVFLASSAVGVYIDHGFSPSDAATLANSPLPLFLTGILSAGVSGILTGVAVGLVVGLGLNLLIWPEIPVLKRAGMALLAGGATGLFAFIWGAVVSLLVWLVCTIIGIEDLVIAVVLGMTFGLAAWVRLISLGWIGYPKFPHPIP